MTVGFYKLGVSHTLGRETADDLDNLIRRRLALNFCKELSNAFSIWLVLRLISCGTTRVDYRQSCDQKQMWSYLLLFSLPWIQIKQWRRPRDDSVMGSLDKLHNRRRSESWWRPGARTLNKIDQLGPDSLLESDNRFRMLSYKSRGYAWDLDWTHSCLSTRCGSVSCFDLLLPRTTATVLGSRTKKEWSGVVLDNSRSPSSGSTASVTDRCSMMSFRWEQLAPFDTSPSSCFLVYCRAST